MLGTDVEMEELAKEAEMQGEIEPEEVDSDDNYDNYDSYDYYAQKSGAGTSSSYSSSHDFEDFSSTSSTGASSQYRPRATYGATDTTRTSSSYSPSSDKFSSNIYRMDSATQKLKLTILRLERLEEAVKVADCITEGNTIALVDFRNVQRDVFRRIVDFIDGVRYTCGAQMESIADYIYVLFPSDIELTGDLLNQIDTGDIM